MAPVRWVVFAAYGWTEGIGDEEILKKLLALNIERSVNCEETEDGSRRTEGREALQL